VCPGLTMPEIGRLPTKRSAALVRRYDRPATLVFSDVVNSTAFFAKFGDMAGRQLLQRHVDLLQQSIGPSGGRVVDTAGDGAFVSLPSVDDALTAMVELLGQIAIENTRRPREQPLAVRIGLHQGPVLTDGVQVSGDAVNVCARIAASAEAGEIRMSKAAFLALTKTAHRLKCRPLPPTVLKGLDRPIDLMVVDWRDRAVWLSSVRLDTGQEFPIPDQDVVTFGRLEPQEGKPGNDIVLRCGDDVQSLQISRWHVELRRLSCGWAIRSVTAAPTKVNGADLAKGDELPIRPGDQVRVGNVLSLFFEAPPVRPEVIDAQKTVILPDA
ncbi:MAG: adenylate/guanylate cyclase domain-containing protein, partial [Vicinamibacterales bacterium]|nr:adenylate/guanylate cyclase domain-containing protein [Vicinamibacterales bacterium]